MTNTAATQHDQPVRAYRQFSQHISRVELIVNGGGLTGACWRHDPVAAGILPAVEGGILPPGSALQYCELAIPPGKMPGLAQRMASIRAIDLVYQGELNPWAAATRERLWLEYFTAEAILRGLEPRRVGAFASGQ